MNMDNYFKDNAARRAALGDAKFFQTVDLDSPAAYQMQQLSLDIDQLKAGRPIRSPQYDMTNSRSMPDHTPVTASPVTLVEGLMLFAKESAATPPAASPDLEPKFDLTMSVDLDNAQRKARWQQHQIEARGGIGDGSQKAHDDMWQKIELKKAEYIDPRKPQMTIHIDNSESREVVSKVMDRLAKITRDDLILPFTADGVSQKVA
jgi:uridine kinase